MYAGFTNTFLGHVNILGFIIFLWEFGRPGSQWMVSVIYCTMTVRLTLLQCDKWFHLQEILTDVVSVRSVDAWHRLELLTGPRDTVASLRRPAVQARSTAVAIYFSHQGTFISHKCLKGTRRFWTSSRQNVWVACRVSLRVFHIHCAKSFCHVGINARCADMEVSLCYLSRVFCC